MTKTEQTKRRIAELTIEANGLNITVDEYFRRLEILREIREDLRCDGELTEKEIQSLTWEDVTDLVNGVK